MRIAAKVGLVVSMAAAMFAAGEGLKLVARDNVARQTALVDRGVDFEREDAFSIVNVRNDQVKHIIEKGFFKQQLVEAPAISALKQRLPTVGASRYFSDPWDLFWYLEFIGDRVGLFHAIDALVSDGFFREQPKCLNDSACRVATAGSNMNLDDGSKMFEIIVRNFVEPALTAYQSMAFEDAHRLASDALLLARKVDFDPTVTSHDYDLVIVIGTLLSQPEAAMGRYGQTDIENLRAYLGEEDADMSDIQSGSIADYVNGIGVLRRGCFSEASANFALLARNAGTDTLSDLYGFLALRSLARPFIDTSLLDMADNGLATSDCGKRVAAEALSAGFEALFPEIRPGIRHPGLASDLDFYLGEVRLSGERRGELIEIVTSRNATDEASAEP